MKRFFNLVLSTLAMLTVALLSAFIAMRLAIHGREVEVPKLTGLTVVEATRVAADQGLNLNLENRFYSTEVPPGQVIAQYPGAGSRVRREWEVRITESLGPQRVTIPDLTGKTERTATIDIRRESLELGSVAHLAAPGDPGLVLTQTPPANTAGADGPRVSLLISDPESAAEKAYVMPSLVGLSYATALARANAVGVRLLSSGSGGDADSLAAPSSAAQARLLNLAPTAETPAAGRTNGMVIGQSPLPGHRVIQGEVVHIILGHASPFSFPQP